MDKFITRGKNLATPIESRGATSIDSSIKTVTCEVTNDSLSKSTEESLKVDCGKLFFIYKENIIEYDTHLKYFILYDYIYFAVEKERL